MSLNIIAPANRLGYGRVTVNLIRELQGLGVTTHFIPIGPIDVEPTEVGFMEKAVRDGQFFNHQAPCLRIFHQHSMAEFMGWGEKIGFPIFELDKFTELELHHLHYPDKLIVCSSWAKSVLSWYREDIEADIVPLGVDLSVFKPGDLPGKRYEWDQTCRFITVGKWEVRKGHDFLLSCFEKAFSPSDNVALTMVCENPFHNLEQKKFWTDKVRNNRLFAKIKLSPRLASQSHIAELFNLHDCGVFLSRAEGWNLDLLEAMACGLPVIATDCTAHSDFIIPEGNVLIKPTRSEDAYDGIWFNHQGRWALLDKDCEEATINGLRQMAGKRLNGFLSNPANTRQAERFSWGESAKKLLEVIS